VVLGAGDQQQRPAARVAGVDPRLCARRQVRERGLEDRARGRRDRPALVERVGLLSGQRVGEPVAELLARQRDRAPQAGRVAQHRQGRPDLRKREHAHALDLGRGDRDGGAGAAVGQQALGDEAAEGVPDDDRRSVEQVDDLVVVVDGVVDARVRHVLRVQAGVGDGRRLAGPAGRDRVIARVAEALDPRAPARRVQPQAVDEDHGRAVGRGGHAASCG
jgi:hypothetical protein